MPCMRFGFIHAADECVSVCFACKEGRYLGVTVEAENDCKDCAIGKFASLTGMTSCETCVLGTHTPQKSATVCFACKVGRFIGNAATYTCEDCARGSFAAATGATTCVKCQVKGQHTKTAGASTCFTCAETTYALSATAAECEVCPKSQHLDCRNGLLVWAPNAWYNVGKWETIGLQTTKLGIGGAQDVLHWNNDSFTHITEASKIFTCFNDISCLYPISGANNESDKSRIVCNEALGYYGPLCGACDKHRNYYRNGYVCSKCKPTEEDIWTMTIIFAVVLVLIIYIAGCHNTKRRLGENGSIVRRIAYSYVQMLGMLGIFKARGTKIFYEAIGKASEAVGGGIMLALPMKCLLETQIYGSFVFQMCLPLFAFIAVAIVMIPTTIIQRARTKVAIKKDEKRYARFKRFAAILDGTLNRGRDRFRTTAPRTQDQLL